MTQETETDSRTEKGHVVAKCGMEWKAEVSRCKLLYILNE